MSKSARSLFVAVVMLVPTLAFGGMITFTPSDTLRVTFNSDPIARPCPGTCDILALYLVPSPFPAGTLVTTRLYSQDSTLLGIRTSDPTLGLAFRSSASAYLAATTIDFGPLIVPFSGYFEVTTNATIRVNSVFTNVNLGTGDEPGGFTYDPRTARKVSVVKVAVPETSTVVLLGGAMLAFAPLLRKRVNGLV